MEVAMTSKANHSPIIQVAGVLDLEEAKMLIDAGFTHLGYPLFLDYHKEDMSLEQVRDVISQIGKACEHVLITYLENAEKIKDALDFLNTDWVQLHGLIDSNEIIKLMKIRPASKVIKSLVVGRESAEQIENQITTLSDHVTAFITDTYDPETGASGATGKTHDWSISKKIIESTKTPVIIAGGLNQHNVADAIEKTGAAGVDVHTGIEGPDGKKDPSKARAFVDNSKKLFI